jgi:hypothetical protein
VRRRHVSYAQHTAELSRGHESVVSSESTSIVDTSANLVTNAVTNGMPQSVDFNPTRSPKAYKWSLGTRRAKLHSMEPLAFPVLRHGLRQENGLSAPCPAAPAQRCASWRVWRKRACCLPPKLTCNRGPSTSTRFFRARSHCRRVRFACLHRASGRVHAPGLLYLGVPLPQRAAKANRRRPMRCATPIHATGAAPKSSKS